MPARAQPETLTPSAKPDRSSGVHVRSTPQTLVRKRVRRTAICSRVTLSLGANVVGDVPSTTPVSYAQAIAA